MSNNEKIIKCLQEHDIDVQEFYNEMKKLKDNENSKKGKDFFNAIKIYLSKESISCDEIINISLKLKETNPEEFV